MSFYSGSFAMFVCEYRLMWHVADVVRGSKMAQDVGMVYKHCGVVPTLFGFL